MLHYIRHNDAGELVGCDTRGFGWPDGADPRDPNTTDPVAKLLQQKRENPKYGFSGWVPYTCGCRRKPVSCGCAKMIVSTHYYNGVVLFPKPDLTLEIDGIDGSTDSINDRTPEAEVDLVLKAAAPDGHEALIVGLPGVYNALPETTKVTFSGGRTNLVRITVPPQGVVTTLHTTGKYVKTCIFSIRGWA